MQKKEKEKYQDFPEDWHFTAIVTEINIFCRIMNVLYAVLEPVHELPDHLQKIKSNARRIIARVDKGEKVVTSVVHLSEVAYILESRKSFVEASQFIYDLITKESIRVLDVTHNDYQGATVLAQRYKVGINYSLAKILMDRLNINEIYSFDKHFDNLKLLRIIK